MSARAQSEPIGSDKIEGAPIGRSIDSADNDSADNDSADNDSADNDSADNDSAGIESVGDESVGIESVGDEVDAIVAAWQRERPDLDVEPLQVLSRLDRLAGVLGERRSAIFAQHGLRRHEFDVLAALRRAGVPFELTAGELSARTYVTSGTMTSRLDGLTERGLVTRAADRVDGRLVRVTLTADGRQIVDAAFGALLAAERDLLTPLPPETIAPLAATLRALLARAVAP